MARIADRLFGRIVKRLGGGLMTVFPSAQLAFDAVGDARERLELVEVAGYRPLIRAGLHTGRPQVIGGDYLGVDVNVDPPRVDARRKKSFVFGRVKGVPDGLAVDVASAR